MITGFFRSSRQEESIGFPSYFSGDVFISHVFFMLYFYHVHTSPFPVIQPYSHLLLFSLPRLSCSVSYHRKQPCKMFIKTLKSISSYVPHRRPTVVSALAFFYPSNEQVTMTQQSHLPLCLLCISLIHLNLKLSAIFHPVSAAFLLHQFATSPRSIPTGLKKCFPYKKPTFPCTYLRFMSCSG